MSVDMKKLSNLIELQPDYAEAYNNLGNVYKEMEEYNQAISVYEKAIELNPEYYEASGCSIREECS